MSPGVNRSSPTEACRAQLCIPCWHVGPCAMIRPERGCDGTNISSASPDGLFCCLFRAVSTSLLPIINLCCLPCSLSYTFPVFSASLLRSRTLSHGHSSPPLPLHLFINTRASKTFHRMHSSLPLVLALPVICPPVPPTSTAMHGISARPTSPRSSPPPYFSSPPPSPRHPSLLVPSPSLLYPSTHRSHAAEDMHERVVSVEVGHKLKHHRQRFRRGEASVHSLPVSCFAQQDAAHIDIQHDILRYTTRYTARYTR